MAKNYWLVKSEPESYSWATFVKDGGTAWTGVRNFQARNNLRAMKPGDAVLFYHSVSEKQVVGVAKVKKESYPDPTAKEGDWSAVDCAGESAGEAGHAGDVQIRQDIERHAVVAEFPAVGHAADAGTVRAIDGPGGNEVSVKNARRSGAVTYDCPELSD